MKSHVRGMLIAGGAVLVVLIVAGVDLRTAVPYALLLACPLMMFFMMRGHMGGAGHGGHHGSDAAGAHEVVGANGAQAKANRGGRATTTTAAQAPNTGR